MLERSIVFHYGEYRKRVPMLIPFTRAKDVCSLRKYATHS